MIILQVLNSFAKLSLKTKILLSWLVLDVILSILIAITTNEFSLVIYLFLWVIISIIVYKLKPPFFVLSAFILAAFAGSLPVFLAIK